MLTWNGEMLKCWNVEMVRWWLFCCSLPRKTFKCYPSINYVLLYYILDNIFFNWQEIFSLYFGHALKMLSANVPISNFTEFVPQFHSNKIVSQIQYKFITEANRNSLKLNHVISGYFSPVFSTFKLSFFPSLLILRLISVLKANGDVWFKLDSRHTYQTATANSGIPGKFWLRETKRTR